MNLMYCAWDADKNKQQLGLQEFLFGISMTQKTKDRQPKILQAGYHTQRTGHEIIQCK